MNLRFYKLISLLCFISVYAALAQEVFLRLTDYAGGKTNLVIEPFAVQGTPDFVTRVKSIESIIKSDLDYSLYFEIFSDTASLNSNPRKTGVIIRASSSEPNLTLALLDFETKEKIGEISSPIVGELHSFAHRLSDKIIEILTGEKGVSATKIVFSYSSGTGKELAMIDYDGFNFIPLTKNKNFNLFPCWAPDGNRILYSTYIKDRLNLNLLDLNQKSLTIISTFAGLNYAPDWSPDGSKIALTLTKDGNAEIYLLDLNSQELHRLTNNRAIDCSPSFSPNSREIAFVSDRSGTPQIYVMDILGGNVRRLTFHGDYNTSPAWSPRGDLIAYVARQPDYSQQICVTDPNDFQPIRLTFDGNNEEPSWSPDGLHIVFISNRTGQYELWTMNWDGTRQRKLSQGIAAYAPDWSPFIK
ncbi:MAG: hypothetical protein ACUVTF_07590 [bacterium]